MSLLNQTTAAYIAAIPKVELHLHIEGSFEPELVFKIAERNGLPVRISRPAAQSSIEQAAIDALTAKAKKIGLKVHNSSDAGIDIVFDNAEQLKQAYEFNNLQEFLDIYYAGMNVLQHEQDFYDLTMAYLAKCHGQNVMHCEIFFDPQGHTERGIAFDTVINGIWRGLRDGEENYGISNGLILCFLRHLSQDQAFATWHAAIDHIDKLIAVGLDSSELGNPPVKFSQVFAQAKQQGLKLVAHAGEEGPPAYIWQALNELKVDRVDHGNRALEDEKLVQYLRQQAMALTVCPLSNYKLQVVRNLAQHPLKKMLDLGLNVTINSDDPAYFGGYMSENMMAMHTHIGLTQQDINQLMYNAIDSSFASLQRKAEMRLQLDDFCNKACV